MQREVFLEISELTTDLLVETAEIPTSSIQDNPEAVGAHLRELLGIPIEEQVTWRNPNTALSAWIETVTSLGILVIQTRGVDLDVARGFSIGEWPYPVIGLNGSDWPNPRIFTLMHELAHLSLRAGGLCDLHEVRSRTLTADESVERFCNAVAASILLPADAVRAVPAVARAGPDTPWELDELLELAGRFRTSSEALLLRLISLEAASWDTYWRLKSEMETAYQDARERLRQRQQESEGGPSYYTLKARDLGSRYVSTVIEAYEVKAISSLDAADYLDIKYNNLGKLAQVVAS